MTPPATQAIVALVTIGDLMLWIRVGTVVAGLGVLALLLGSDDEEDAQDARDAQDEAIEVQAPGPVRSLSFLVRNRR